MSSSCQSYSRHQCQVATAAAVSALRCSAASTLRHSAAQLKKALQRKPAYTAAAVAIVIVVAPVVAYQLLLLSTPASREYYCLALLTTKLQSNVAIKVEEYACMLYHQHQHRNIQYGNSVVAHALAAAV
eukprot:11611-Heterococcus_DN1.PRE.8